MGLVYISFPVYVMATKPFGGLLAAVLPGSPGCTNPKTQRGLGFRFGV